MPVTDIYTNRLQPKSIGDYDNENLLMSTLR